MLPESLTPGAANNLKVLCKLLAIGAPDIKIAHAMELVDKSLRSRDNVISISEFKKEKERSFCS